SHGRRKSRSRQEMPPLSRWPWRRARRAPARRRRPLSGSLVAACASTLCGAWARVNWRTLIPPMASSVLVVDDDPNLVRLMSKFLALEGFAPVPAANGEEALRYLRGGGDASVILLAL